MELTFTSEFNALIPDEIVFAEHNYIQNLMPTFTYVMEI